MKAYKCDICGKLYNKRNGILIKSRNDMCYVFEEYFDDKVCNVDVCPDCISDIQEVIDKKSEKNE